MVDVAGGKEPSVVATAGTDPLEQVLTGSEVRQKAASGVFMLGLRTVVVRGVGFLGTLVLARLLVPQDFGVLAFGQTLIMFGAFFTDVGIAAGLVRREQPPSRRELQTILGFQLAVTTALVCMIAIFAVPSGRSGQVATLMAASVILTACRTPAGLLLERRLDYRAIAAVEVLEGVIFVVVSVSAVALGAGVWGVAAAHIVRAAAGSALMVSRSPMKVFRPRLHLGIIRELLAYGLIMQAGALVNLLRVQGMNLTTAAVAGLPVLGYYSLVERLMQIPWLLFESLLRVSFPAMVRLIAAGEDARADLDRGLRLLTVAAGAVLCLVAATAPVLVSAFFGEQWQPAAGAVPLIALGMLLAGPIVAVGNGYLYAIGDARQVLAGTALHAVMWYPVALPLIPHFGATAVGAGVLAGFAAEGLLLAWAVHRRTGLNFYRIIAAPLVALIAAGSVGFGVARQLEPTLLAVAGVALLTGVLLMVGLLLTARPTLLDALHLSRRTLARARG